MTHPPASIVEGSTRGAAQRFAWRSLVRFLGALYFSFGWQWHVFRHQLPPAMRLRTLAVALLLWGAYEGVRALAAAITRAAAPASPRGQLVERWGEAFFWLFASVGTVFFLRPHSVRHTFIIALCVAFLVLGYLALRSLLPPSARRGAVFLAGEIFLSIVVVQLLLQYVVHRYAIIALTASSWRSVVLLRTVAISAFWFFGLMVATAGGRLLPRRIRFLPLIVWGVGYLGGIFLGLLNIAIAYYSGLYFTPILFSHVRGAAGVVFSAFSFSLLGVFVALAAVTAAVLRRYLRAIERQRPEPLVALLVISLGLMLASGARGAWRQLPEYVVLRSLYETYLAQRPAVALTPQTLSKLERFGLRYRLDEFFVARRDQIFDAPLGPARPRRPNVVIIFWESFSSRLSEAYNPKLAQVTPGLQAMLAHPNTTLFRNYSNATTQTVTSLLATLCSFLPPFGHEEVRQLEDLSRLRLSCLPNLLRDQGWRAATYLTAVQKDFANKDSLLLGMGVTSLGTAELKRLIPEPPRSWGYSDHQLFPVLWRLSQESPEPFLLMMTTIDSHPPYNLSQDAVPYGDGRNALLNAIHSTDDAFKKFWESFTASDLFDRTVVVVVGDHPAFPSVLLQDTIQPADGQVISYYDETFFALYVPDSPLPRVVETYASSLDFTPTLLHLLNINVPNVFEGHSIFGTRPQYPNLIGLDASGLYSSQLDAQGRRHTRYDLRPLLVCRPDAPDDPALTACELKDFFLWKRALYAQGRLFAP